MAQIAKQVDLLLAGIRDPNTDEPLSSGEVDTYQDGTSKKVALWLDRQKSSRANNPITLDANGKAEVYGDGIYKFEIYGPRDDEGNKGPLLETITGLDIFASETVSDQWISQADTIEYDSATSILVKNEDATAEYHMGRRIRAQGDTTGIIYGAIDSSSYDSGTGNTTVNITWDSGSLADEQLDIALGIITSKETSLPRPLVKAIKFVRGAISISKQIKDIVLYEDDGSGNAVIRPPFVDKAIGGVTQYEDDGSGNPVIRPPFVDKAVGGVTQYEDDGNGNPVVDHPNKPAQRESLGLGTSDTVNFAVVKESGTRLGPVEEYRRELGGDFDSGQTVVILRIGNLVTITAEKGGLTHTSTSRAVSASDVIPSHLIPSGSGNNDVHFSTYQDGNFLQQIQLGTDGEIESESYNYDGTSKSVSISHKWSISYILEQNI
jgi:hypothetical protein